MNNRARVEGMYSDIRVSFDGMRRGIPRLAPAPLAIDHHPSLEVATPSLLEHERQLHHCPSHIVTCDDAMQLLTTASSHLTLACPLAFAPFWTHGHLPTVNWDCSSAETQRI